MRTCATILALLLRVPAALAVQPYTPVHPDPVLEPWRWTVYPELKWLGLRYMAEATDGAMWFGVDEGVVRYDGIEWQTFTPDDGVRGAPVNVLCAAGDGSVYAGSDWGISRYREGVWEHVFPPEGDLPWPVNDLMEARDGSIWAGTGWGALRLTTQDALLHTSGNMERSTNLSEFQSK